MSYRRSSPPTGRDSGPSSSSSRSYDAGRSGYPDRRPPPPSSSRGYRDDYESRSPRRSRSPPRSKQVRHGRDRRDDRYDDRSDRDYPRDAPPAPRDDRRSRPTGPTPPPRQGDHSERRRQASPLRRTERDQRHEEERGRNAREEEPSRLERQASSHGQGEGEDEEDGEVIEDPEADMMAAMGFGGFRTTKNTKVDGNQSGAAEVKKERTWRQYMQRKGGFNRPLSPVRKH